MTIGEKIRSFGVGKYGSIKAFGEALDMNPSSLQSYMRGERLPGTPILQKLKKLGCSIDWLLDNNSESDDQTTLSPQEIRIKELELENNKLRKRIRQLTDILSNE